MQTKGIIEEDFVNYYKPSMVIMAPQCNWKCGKDLCQNSPMATATDIAISPEYIVKRYLQNELTEALVFSGLEPIDSLSEVIEIIDILRNYTEDPVIIYTGYNEKEIPTELEALQEYRNIIIKFGRFIPNQLPQKDEVLGISLVSNNQYAKKVS